MTATTDAHPSNEHIRKALGRVDAAPRTPTIAHVGVSVPDSDLAIAWYTKVLGFELLSGPVEVDVTVDEGWAAPVRDIHGPTIGRLRLTQLTGANGSGVELLEYLEPRFTPTDGWDFTRAGTTHLNIVDPDVEGLVDRVERAGGRRRTSQVWPLAPDSNFRFAFVEDPWGTVIEVYSHTPERVYGGPPQS